MKYGFRKKRRTKIFITYVQRQRVPKQNDSTFNFGRNFRKDLFFANFGLPRSPYSSTVVISLQLIVRKKKKGEGGPDRTQPLKFSL